MQRSSLNTTTNPLAESGSVHPLVRSSVQFKCHFVNNNNRNHNKLRKSSVTSSTESSAAPSTTTLALH